MAQRRLSGDYTVMDDDTTSHGRFNAPGESGLRKRYFSNLTWTREDADEQGQAKSSGAGAASLLSRIQPASSSLLDRIAPIHDNSQSHPSEGLTEDVKPTDESEELRRDSEGGPSTNPGPTLANAELVRVPSTTHR